MDGALAMAVLYMAMHNCDHPLPVTNHHSERGSECCYFRYVSSLKGQGMLLRYGSNGHDEKLL